MIAAGRGSLPWQRDVVDVIGNACVMGRGRDARAIATWRRLGGTPPVSHWQLDTASGRFFVKVAAIGERDALDAERDGLQAIAATRTVRVPTIIDCAEVAGVAFLVLEWLEIVRSGGGAALGAALARMHASLSPRFGWHRDNRIGATPQLNAWGDDWSVFFRDRRLAPQIELAARNGHVDLAREGRKLLERVPALLANHRPSASLLHGDLWSGNAATLVDGEPVILDPAVYYGDAEADVAMASLFGGFDASFFEAHASAAPPAAGQARRRTLYNLYHVLNHANLFGGGYPAQAQRMMDELNG